MSRSIAICTVRKKLIHLQIQAVYFLIYEEIKAKIIFFFQIHVGPQEEMAKLVVLVIIFGCLKLLLENLVGYP